MSHTNSTSLLFSPLDQFDNVAWLSSRTIETSDVYSLFTFENERDAWTLFSSSYASSNSVLTALATNGLSSRTLVVLLVLAVTFGWRFLPVGSVSASPVSALAGFSHLFLLAAIHLLTGGFITVWFSDLLIPGTITNTGSSLTATARDSVSLSFAPQLDFSFYVDERRVTLFLAFFLLGAGEEEEDEDRLRSEEADLSRVEEIVAPIVLTNLGKEVSEIPALYLQVCGLFAFLLTSNLRGRVPYSDTATSSLGLTFCVSFAAFASLVSLRLRKHGIGYLARLFRPSGTPFPLLFLLIPIEFLSYSFRLVSLAVRLFANRFAGHTLRKVLIGFAYVFLTLGDLYAIASVVPALVVFVLVFLERAVAVIQAYIFTTLLALYRKDIFVGH